MIICVTYLPLDQVAISGSRKLLLQVLVFFKFRLLWLLLLLLQMLLWDLFKSKMMLCGAESVVSEGYGVCEEPLALLCDKYNIGPIFIAVQDSYHFHSLSNWNSLVRRVHWRQSLLCGNLNLMFLSSVLREEQAVLNLNTVLLSSWQSLLAHTHTNTHTDCPKELCGCNWNCHTVSPFGESLTIAG